MALGGSKSALLAKIARNLTMLGIANTADVAGGSVVVDGLTVSYVDTQIQSPMGGVDPAASPFLGLGVVNPGQLKIKGAAGQNTLAAIFTSELRMKVLRVVTGPANTTVVEAGDTTATLATMPGWVDGIGMGQ